MGETNFHTREFPRSGSKAKDGEKKREKERNTPGTAGGPLGHDRTLAVKSRKTDENQLFFRKKKNYFLRQVGHPQSLEYFYMFLLSLT